MFLDHTDTIEALPSVLLNIGLALTRPLYISELCKLCIVWVAYYFERGQNFEWPLTAFFFFWGTSLSTFLVLSNAKRKEEETG
jgi:hypothetical protein